MLINPINSFVFMIRTNANEPVELDQPNQQDEEDGQSDLENNEPPIEISSDSESDVDIILGNMNNPVNRGRRRRRRYQQQPQQRRNNPHFLYEVSFTAARGGRAHRVRNIRYIGPLGQ